MIMMDPVCKRMLDDWYKKLAAVINKNDFNAFKEFWIKNNAFITGGMDIPNDDIMKVTMWKTACNIKGVYPKIKEEAKKKLESMGFSTIV